ncbi:MULTISPECIES: acetylglutamate kinase [Olivibacter]|nr:MULTISPECIES: acetylglutamate kinase [Olivibacter]MCL4642157.1 acetylglutamate kinase [Olivibacter sp. UJ_SKK_5.1]MDM8177676.1 acetylglutamate kinase [Olivibacter sp. 47]MDX3911902.1 acetylglutamate kinase [Pseudosphingobacterium sp.]QEK99649.1 acetylglutamate kinase [Olivibacter sp. LS-1]
MEKLNIVKIGGNIVENETALSAFTNVFANLKGKKILVHGGGKIASKLASDLGIEAKMVNGRRITDLETLKIVTMVYAGLTNKSIVALLQANHCDAIGLSGADGNTIRTIKRPVKEIDYGFAGDMTPTSIHNKRIQSLLELGLCPVFSAITHNGEGQLLNTNADTIASALAVGLASNYDISLIYCFEKRGVLKDIEDEGSVITQINRTHYSMLKEQGIIADGMIPKLDNAFDAISKGVKKVIIKHANDLTDEQAGTTIF